MTTRRRWGDEAPADNEAARLRLIEAANACVDRFGLAKTTLEDVATEAAVSRQTIYRYVANRDELILEALLLELQRAELDHPFEILVEEIQTPEDVARAVVESVVHTIVTIRETPKLAHLLVAEADSVRSTLSGASEALFDHHERELRPWLEMAQRAGLLRRGLDISETTEWILRMAVSLLTVDGPVQRDADELRTYLFADLAPVLAPAEATADVPPEGS
ncbi:MAG: helix-turn-helix domain-containing protein [Acidimicrobiia bacterium]|nr:helix-turn-helix domain-containing protein [Acidimicrobiia bacterium]